jgi:hypothetical protein
MAIPHQLASMIQGPHAALATEVLGAVAEGRVLSPSKRLDLRSARVITDFVLACDFAWEQDVDGATGWNDLRSRHLSKMKAKGAARPELAPLLNGRLDVERWIRETLAPRLSTLPESIASDVASDLFHAILQRVLQGVGEDLFETIFQPYLHGGWPCGWEGEYPEGMLVVYQLPLA